MPSNCVECTNCDSIAAMLSTPEVMEFYVTQGQTWNELIAIPDLEFDSGCTSYLTMRVSPGGREYARFTSEADHIFLSSAVVTEPGDDGNLDDVRYGGVRLAVPAAAVAALVPLDYWYTWVVRCCGQSYTVAYGIAHVQSNLVVGGPDCADTMPEVVEVEPDEVLITSLNEALHTCCKRHEPLFFHVASSDLVSVEIDGDGEFYIQSLVGNKWVNDAFLSSETSEHRIVYYRYGVDYSLTSQIARDDYVGGSADCGECDDECPESFSITIRARNGGGNSAVESFTIEVEGC